MENAMVFKAHWEKAQQRNTVSDTLLQDIIYSQMDASVVKSYQLISGGCANWNIKVDLISGDILIFRIYIRDQSAAMLEQYLHDSLRSSSSIPVPYIKNSFVYADYTVSIMEYIEGYTLRDVLLEYIKNGMLFDKEIQKGISSVMYSLGSKLRDIGKIDTKAFVDLSYHSSAKKLHLFVQNLCKDKKLLQVFPQIIQLKIYNILTTKLYLLEETRATSLVHGDYDPANIMVSTKNGQLQMVAILDWEFAHIGSQIWDVANMLRYQHEMPSVFSGSFLRGFLGEGVVISDKAHQQIALCNLLSLLDCLQRVEIAKCPNQVEDTRRLVTHILRNFDT